MFARFSLEKTYQNLLITLAFLMPLTVAGANIVIAIICLIWLFSGNYTSKFLQIKDSKFLIASLLFFLLHIFGLLWTEDLSWGLHIVHKMWYFLLLLPVLFTIVKKEYIKFYLYGFFLAIAFTEVISYLVWFEIIPPFKNATVQNPTPFMSHISYNPIITVAIYLVLHEIFFNKNITNFLFTFYCFFAISMSINMFITGGRAGQVAFFVMLVIMIFQVFDKQRFKSLLLIFIVIPGIFLSAYQSSELFQKRVNDAVAEVTKFPDQNETSVGLRINFAVNSLEVIRNNLLFGVGTGDFPSEYSKINKKNSPKLPNVTNPHNMYILVLMQLGLLGLVSMLSIFYYQLRISRQSSNQFFKNFGLTLPILFLVLMLSDSYLLGHYTTLVYVFFSSFLYKEF
tara:strand:+ start:168 stop:1358 length:1191 start_codon:yes stop_codon:yes gene_type:complete